MSKMNQLIGLFQAESIRIEKIIHIPLAFSDSFAAADDLKQLLGFDDPEDWPAELSAALKGCDHDDVEGMLEVLMDANFRGFLVHLNAARRTYHGGPNDGHSFSWGSYSTQWFFVPSIEALAEPTKAWLEERIKVWRAASAKGGAA
jgi:hypothetical protein